MDQRSACDAFRRKPFGEQLRDRQRIRIARALASVLLLLSFHSGAAQCRPQAARAPTWHRSGAPWATQCRRSYAAPASLQRHSCATPAPRVRRLAAATEAVGSDRSLLGSPHTHTHNGQGDAAHTGNVQARGERRENQGASATPTPPGLHEEDVEAHAPHGVALRELAHLGDDLRGVACGGLDTSGWPGVDRHTAWREAACADAPWHPHHMPAS